ncbi:MAG: group 1 truncated hemoglobin [Gammaproteobacteria bacterium]|nr:group 1 truncated hemoglobin [Gammaproteobacteria bacterium]
MQIKTILSILVAAVMLLACSSESPDTSAPTEKSLYDRMGGQKKVKAIVEDIWNNHSANPIVKDRFADSDPAYVKKRVFEIFAAASGATDVQYNGLDMKAAHKGMNISEMEFNAVVDDVLAACEKHKIAQQKRNEVLAILWSVRKDIVNSHIITEALVN